MVFEDFWSKLEVHMYTAYADLYELLRIFSVLCAGARFTSFLSVLSRSNVAPVA
jgi:hypothetical protein